MRLKLIALLLEVSMIAACSRAPSTTDELATSGYLHWNDRFRAIAFNFGIPGVPFPCQQTVVEGGVKMIGSKSTDQCERMTPPRRWRGLWRYAFEAPQFCEAPAKKCPTSPPGTYVEISFAKMPPGLAETPPGGLYAIDFVGRRTIVPQPYFGRPRQDVIVDRLISIKELQPPPPGAMTKELVEEYRQECAGAQLCMPNSEVSMKK
jgi:hypothetical protein